MTGRGALADAFDGLLAAAAEQAQADAEHGATWSAGAWRLLVDAGITTVSVPEAAGGAGGTVTDAYELLELAGRHALSLPLAESGLLAGWLLRRAGRSVAGEPTTVAPGTRNDDIRLVRGDGEWRVSGTAHRVPWGADAERILLVLEHDGSERLLVVPRERIEVRRGGNLAAEPRDRLRFDEVPLDADQVVTVAPGTRDELLHRGALGRAALMAGALGRVAELSVEYAQVRHQFGRPIGRFQAVAQSLAQMVEHAERARLAVLVSVRMAAAGHHPATVARAKILAGEAAGEVTALAHQIHGAIGMTAEYPLGRYSRRLWSWADEYGGEAFWARIGGERLLAGGPGGVWPAVTETLVDAEQVGG